jgi:hypothetical protein
VLLGKSGGILYSPLLLQYRTTPSEVSVQLQTLGHDDATPTSKITATIAVIRNCMLRRQSTNTKCIYLIMCNIVIHV